MEIVINGIEYDKKGNVLQRKNNESEYSVTLHFGESKTSTITEIQNVLKKEFIKSKTISRGAIKWKK